MTTEFEAPAPLDAVSRRAIEIARVATEAECAAIAARLGLARVEAVSLTARLRRMSPGDIFAASGRAELLAERICGVTLEPFVERTVAEFEERFTTTPDKATPEDELLGPDEREIELVETDRIDLGELALQYLALALDPYPRGPDADAAEAADSGPDVAAGKRRPFADLGRMLGARQEKS